MKIKNCRYLFKPIDKNTKQLLYQKISKKKKLKRNSEMKEKLNHLKIEPILIVINVPHYT